MKLAIRIFVFNAVFLLGLGAWAAGTGKVVPAIWLIVAGVWCAVVAMVESRPGGWNIAEGSEGSEGSDGSDGSEFAESMRENAMKCGIRRDWELPSGRTWALPLRRTGTLAGRRGSLTKTTTQERTMKPPLEELEEFFSWLGDDTRQDEGPDLTRVCQAWREHSLEYRRTLWQLQKCYKARAEMHRQRIVDGALAARRQAAAEETLRNGGGQ